MRSNNPSTHTALLPLLPGASEHARYSCLGCRKRKVRCDRVLPRCTTCQQWNADCHYQLTPARLRKALARAPETEVPGRGGGAWDEGSTSSNSSSLSPTTDSPSQPARFEGAPTAVGTVFQQPSRRDSALLQTAPLGLTRRDRLGPEGPLFMSANPPLESPEADFYNNGSSTAMSSSSSVLPSPALDPTERGLLPTWLLAGIRQLSMNNPVDDSISQRTARLMFKLMRNSLASQARRNSSQSHLSPPASQNEELEEEKEELEGVKGKTRIVSYDILPDNGGKSPSLRTLFSPVDLLYHSSVVRHSMDDFCTLIYRGSSPLHRLRILYRLDNQLVPEAYQLAAMMAVAPFSNHPAFEHIPPHMISREYHSRLIAMLPHCLADPSPDMFVVLGMLTEATLGLGYLSLHQTLLAASIRKQHGIRSYLIDHPNPPPRPTHFNTDTDTMIDAPTIANEFLREHYRIVWWAHFNKDMMAALIFGHKPLIDLDNCYVNLPSPDQDVEARLDAELANPDSDIYTSTEYPTMVNNTRIKNNIIIIKADISIIGHRVAQLRSRQATDPTAWLQALPGLNKELEQWYDHFAELDGKYWRISPYTSALPTQKEADSFCIQVRVMCAMLIIYLNHFDGHSPSDTNDPYPGLALNQAAGDSTGRTLTECHERCWLYILRFRELMIQSFTPPAFINNSLFTSALYPAAVVCNERIHGMGTIQPSPADPADRKLATVFIDEIIQVLASFGQLWRVNLKIVQEVENIRDTPFVRRSLSMEHLV
ncbi:hypothetical protein H4R33_006447 [Dimargaris cristalligena]|uniref:Zn(2)-C6 fungal-type domain-containing protein n=1 Tax=Dimargaris cristalligena TaxID=215637 RepID=A0A4P9ZPK4_9FUNG|nr:hypothetical protein H4R33_006447 [Dimargaris cristalligena]RKP34280.1 hypothetical protein BJ085DRAFT_39313 [Dimargaris cristalligena]|eukprot:RKP34280.1 hypothetical protein BJ085DRAFT_39313 [Dimargaris cristalligena]